MNRSIAAPASPIRQMVCSDQDQSTPAHLTGTSVAVLLAGVAGCGWFIAVVAPVCGRGVPGRARLPVGH